jgi:hypothetical protein
MKTASYRHKIPPFRQLGSIYYFHSTETVVLFFPSLVSK